MRRSSRPAPVRTRAATPTPTNDSNITATNTTQTPLTTYENYLAEQLPVVYQPNTVTSLTEIAKGLNGATPAERILGPHPGELAVQRLTAGDGLESSVVIRT